MSEVDLPAAEHSLAQVDQWIRGLREGDSWSLFAVGRGVRQFESTDELRKVLDGWKSGLGADEFRSATHWIRR